MRASGAPGHRAGSTADVGSRSTVPYMGHEELMRTNPGGGGAGGRGSQGRTRPRRAAPGRRWRSGARPGRRAREELAEVSRGSRAPSAASREPALAPYLLPMDGSTGYCGTRRRASSISQCLTIVQNTRPEFRWWSGSRGGEATQLLRLGAKIDHLAPELRGALRSVRTRAGPAAARAKRRARLDALWLAGCAVSGLKVRGPRSERDRTCHALGWQLET